MSRYDIPTTDPIHTTCVVGWDNPLQTLFAQVTRRPTDADEKPIILQWVGDRPSACLDVAQLAEAIAPWAILPHAIAAALASERDTAPPPSRLQTLLGTFNFQHR